MRKKPSSGVALVASSFKVEKTTKTPVWFAEEKIFNKKAYKRYKSSLSNRLSFAKLQANRAAL